MSSPLPLPSPTGPTGLRAAVPPMPKRRSAAAALAGLLVAAALAGCATVRRVDADVNSFGSWPEARTPSTFAFERLPSQQAHPEQQDELEGAALPALETAGFRPAPAGTPADALVQVAARTLREDRGYGYPYGDPFLRGGLFYGSRWRAGGLGLGYGWGGPTLYLTEVSMLIRDSRTKQVLYETRASHQGLWGDVAIRAALFEAAMKDFPRQAVSPRRITVDIPR